MVSAKTKSALAFLHFGRAALRDRGTPLGSGPPASGNRPKGRQLTFVSPRDTISLVIKSFKGEFAEAIHGERRVPKGFPADIAKVARRKLVQLNNAALLGDLATPPGNRLEALKGGFTGKHSIRINDQWRVVFRWTANGAEDVEITDYH
jgi:proteic killer suppression protein